MIYYNTIVDPRGIEPRNPPCHGGSLPIAYGPVVWTMPELNRRLVNANDAYYHYTNGPIIYDFNRKFNSLKV